MKVHEFRFRRHRIVLAMAALTLCSVSALGQSTKVQHYTNSTLGIELSYPAVYAANSECTEHAARWQWQCILHLAPSTGKTRGDVDLVFDPGRFSRKKLHELAVEHTGMEVLKRIRIRHLVFYYAGPGGGGVCYPDTYVHNLNGHILERFQSYCIW